MVATNDGDVALGGVTITDLVWHLYGSSNRDAQNTSFQGFLTEYDINYYLSAKPTVFWWAGGSILVFLLTMAGVLLRVFSGWVLALPLLILNGENPVKALSTSRTASVSTRFPIALILLALFLLNAGMLGLLSLLTDFAVDGAIAFAGDSLRILAYLVGSREQHAN